MSQFIVIYDRIHFLVTLVLNVYENLNYGTSKATQK